jgi:outer membrane immunogenic protein
LESLVSEITKRTSVSSSKILIFPIRCGTAATTGKVIACYTHAPSFSGAAMKKLAVGVAAIAALISTPVLAADMVTKAPPPVAPAPVFSWTGFYAGIALGAKWADTTWTTTSISFVGNLLQPAVDSSSPRSYDLSGFRWGGYAGYNWQVAPQWLWGVEADLAGANKTVTAAGIPGCSILCFPAAPGPGTDISSVKMRWDASLRARVGYLVSPDLLAYVTGGIAWQDIETSATCQHSLTDPICAPASGSPFTTATSDTILTGWTIGGGIEYRVYSNWLVRGEYRYSNFGTWTGNFFNLTGPATIGTLVGHSLKVNTQIATGGIGYKF